MEQTQANRASRVFWSVSIGFLVEIFNKLSPLFMLGIGQRRLGVESFGQAQFGISLIEIALPFVLFGYTYQGALEFSLLKKLDRNPAGLVTNIMILKGIHAVVASLLLLALLLAPSWAPHRRVILTILPIILVSALDMTYINFGSQKMIRLSVWVGIFKALSLLGVYLFVHKPADAGLYALLTLSSGTMVGLASFVWAKKYVGFGRPNFEGIKEIFKKSLTFASVVFLFPLYERFDLLLVESIGNPKELGFYTGPWRIAISLIPFFVVICNIFLSESLASQGHREFKQNTSLAFFLCIAVGLPIAVAIPFVGPDILSLIYDPGYRDMNSLFTMFCFSIVLEIFLLVFGLQVLMLKGKSKELSLGLVFTILLGIVAGYVGMQQAGILGLAVGAFLARLVLAIWLVRESLSILGGFPVRDTFNVIVSCLAMAFCLYLLAEKSLWALLLAGGLAYSLVALLLNRDKFRMLKKMGVR